MLCGASKRINFAEAYSNYKLVKFVQLLHFVIQIVRRVDSVQLICNNYKSTAMYVDTIVCCWYNEYN